MAIFGHSPAEVKAFEVEPEVQAFIAALIGAVKPRYVIETGSYEGTTAKTIGTALAAQGNGELDTMDICGQCISITTKKTSGLPVSVHHISSLEFIPKKPIDIAFLDSDVGDLRFRELQRFKQYMSPKGIVILHDADNLWSEHLSLKDWRWLRLNTPVGLALFQREG